MHDFIKIDQTGKSFNKLRVNSTRQTIISNYIFSAAGRSALAAAMINPIRTRIDYQSIGRKLFTVQPLPGGANVLYDFPLTIKMKHDKIVIDNNGKLKTKSKVIPSLPYQGIARRTLSINYRSKIIKNRFIIPTFEIFKNPKISLSEIINRRFIIPNLII